ncbi:hypothetical protein AVEN_129337-1 [Araneus ventricosus]|uniref:C2H2-type domain-containing protein n=1 Tax=Araneus ventricosus TaxID=182803 RepID=A0A4Y2QJW9_ARAVE|nr:hypothetical protein AVEN_129337-1 [Araneus ventricosus]
MSERTFYRLLKKNLNVRIRCPDCMKAMTLDEFYKDHAPIRHNLSKFSVCLFCFGAHGWKRGEKRHGCNWTHMIECLKRFVDANRIRTIETLPVTTPNIPMCGDRCRKSRLIPRDMCVRVKDRTNELYDF